MTLLRIRIAWFALGLAMGGIIGIIALVLMGSHCACP